MKISNFLKSVFCLFVLSIMISSCSKENEDTLLATDDQTNTTTPEQNYRIENDLMIFKSIETFERYYEDMDRFYDEDDQAYSALVESLNINSVTNKMASDVFMNPADRYMPFLSDPIMRGIVNENFEFQVADVLLTYASNDYILTAKSADSEAREKLRKMAKGEKFDVTKVPAQTFLVTTDKFETLLGPWGTVEYKPVEIATPNRSCKIEGETEWGWVQKGNVALSSRSKAFKSWGKTKEETEAFAYARDSANDNWSQENTSFIEVGIRAYRRNGECVYDNFDQDWNHCSNCKSKKVRIKKRGSKYHWTGDVYGTARMTSQSGNIETSFEDNHTPNFD